MEWISTKERMPEPGVDVLLARKNSRLIYVGYQRHALQRKLQEWYRADGCNWTKSAFTHWMPLPEPPKE